MKTTNNKDDHLRKLLIAVIVLGLTLGMIPLQLSKANSEGAAIPAASPESAHVEETVSSESAPQQIAASDGAVSAGGASSPEELSPALSQAVEAVNEDKSASTGEAVPGEAADHENESPEKEPAVQEPDMLLETNAPMLMSLPGPTVDVVGVDGKPTEVLVKDNSGPGWSIKNKLSGKIEISASEHKSVRPIRIEIRLTPDAICEEGRPQLAGTRADGTPLALGDYEVYPADLDAQPQALSGDGGMEQPQEHPEQLPLTYYADIYNFGMNPEDFSSDPDAVVQWILNDIHVTGVTAPAASGGSSGAYFPPEPKPQVENELNQPGISSDTTLQPRNTKEKDGVSTTSVSNREIEALMNLARKHEEDTDQLEGDGYKEGVIAINDLTEESQNNEYRLVLKQRQFNRLAGADWDRLTVETPAGRFSLSGAAIRETKEKSKGDVTFRLQRLDHDGRPGLDLTLQAGAEDVTLFDQPYGVRGFVPYVPQPGEDMNAIVIEYLHEDGEKELVTECFYDEAAGGVYFYSTHLSKFGITYRPAAFKDAGPSHWSNPYVTFLAARGIINGTTGGFRPDDKATRAQFVTLLSRSLSAAKLPSSAMQVYRDVPVDSYAAKASNWVFFNNLDTHMTRNNQLRPGEAITRQDAAAFLGNAIDGSDLNLRSRGLDNQYTDLKSVSDYARNSVQRLTAAGILEMNSSHRFFPKQTMTRGEMAQIIANMITNL